MRHQTPLPPDRQAAVAKGALTAAFDEVELAEGSFVSSERLGLEPSAFGAILEDVGDADCGGNLLDPALHQLEVGVVAQPEGVQSLSLGPGDVTGRWTALGVSVFVVTDEGLPVRVTRPFDRLSNLLPGECHWSSASSSLGSIRPTVANAGYRASALDREAHEPQLAVRGRDDEATLRPRPCLVRLAELALQAGRASVEAERERSGRRGSRRGLMKQ
jgi:hypothetical protein